jgi:hypothetical protein
MLAGRKKYAEESATATVESIPKDYLKIPGGMGNYIQYIYMTPVLVDVRFGNWSELLKRPKPADELIYANVLYHFGTGIASARTADFGKAQSHLDALRVLLKDSVLQSPFAPFSSAIEGATVAEQLLAGVIAQTRNLHPAAIMAFRDAVTREANMIYTEPRDWMLNPRHFLGAEFLDRKMWTEAIRVFEDDLKVNNENGWALFGMATALRGQNKQSEAARMMDRFKKSFLQSEIKLTSPVF